MGYEELPDAELEVLATLWHRGASTAREVREGLAEFRPMTHGAVATLIKRLEEKGLVTRTDRKVGKAFVYRAVVRPGSTYRRKVLELKERLFRGSSVRLVSALFESNPPTRGEIAELERLLADLKRRPTAERDR